MRTLRWVPMRQGFSHFPVLFHDFVLANSATTRIRVNTLSLIQPALAAHQATSRACWAARSLDQSVKTMQERGNTNPAPGNGKPQLPSTIGQRPFSCGHPPLPPRWALTFHIDPSSVDGVYFGSLYNCTAWLAPITLFLLANLAKS